MKQTTQKIAMAIVAIIMFTGVMLLSIEKNNQGQWGFATVSSLAQGGENGGENGGSEDGDDEEDEDEDGNWAAVYPQCEYTISIGIPPLVINKTIRGTYRDCVAGSGVCVYSDNACCGTRVGGICVDPV